MICPRAERTGPSTTLIYAMGGGWGHLTRAVALARHAPQHTRMLVITNSPYASIVRGAESGIEIIAVDPGASATEARMRVCEIIEAARPDSLVVDTFPRGLGGELTTIIESFSGAKVLIERDLSPTYVREAAVKEFVAAHYDVVLKADDPPWLVRSAHELLPRDQAFAILGRDERRPNILVCAAGNREELDWYGEVVARLMGHNMRCIAPECPRDCPPERWIRYWPAIELYSAVDVVVGGAGYNTIHECVACGVPLIARPWPRKYDRQLVRARRFPGVTIVDTPEEAASAALAQPRRTRRIEYRNGVDGVLAT